MIYHSISDNPDKLARIKNFTMFDKELADHTLPQWMFITPNMTNNGHDKVQDLPDGTPTPAQVEKSSNWAKTWIEPLIKPDSNFTKSAKNPDEPMRTLIFISS